jgi:hypothetical protein
VVNPLGHGEPLVLVVGDIYQTRAAAEAAVATSNSGELQGYYVAPTDDFRLMAAYADVRPETGQVPCTAAGIAYSQQTLPELAGIGLENIELLCEQSENIGTVHQLLVSLKSHLLRVPLSISSTGKASLEDPSACEASARCLGQARAALGPGGNLPSGQWMAVSAFRTRAGAEDFVTWVRDTGAGPPEMILQARRIGGDAQIGLGQEANPDGSGPASGPLPQQDALQQ